MKTKYLFFSIVTLLSLFGCSTIHKSVKNKSALQGKEAFTPEMQKVMSQYPEIVGFEKKAIFLSKPTDGTKEEHMKIEIIPGRELYVDCNKYGLQGEMLKRKLEKSGYKYFLFNSNGQIFSTKMACPDDTRTQKFVSGQSLITDYQSDNPIVVYSSHFINVKYTLWKASEMENFDIKKNIKISEDAIKNLPYYPSVKDGYERHVLYLPAMKPDEELNRKVEIIPGKQMKVDCNQYVINGKITNEEVSGFGFQYWTFESDGDFTFTHENCINAVLNDKFISGATEMIPYNSNSPIVVFVPKGISINYKIWETNGKLY